MSVEPWSHEPCPHLTRAWWGDRLVAESSASVRAQPPVGSPQIWFPLADVRLEEFDGGSRVSVDGDVGPQRFWSIDGTVGAPEDPGSDWHTRTAVRVDGRDVLWTLLEPQLEFAWVADHATFDDDRVRVELVESDPDGNPSHVTVTRFPVWGDARDLIAILDVAPEGDLVYVGQGRADLRRPVVEGSQMLGQSVVAAMRHTNGRRVVSAHMVFLRAADSRVPLRFELDERSAGRTFTALGVDVGQGDRLCATGTLLLDDGAPDLVRHAVESPPVPGPWESEPYDMSVTGRDLRIVDGAYTNDPDAPVGPPVLDAWVRFREVPDDPALHAGLLAQFTGHLSLAAALRPHAGIGQHEAHRTLSMAINAIAISFHADVHADRWMRYHHESTFAGDGMTHSECRVHDEQGALLASFTVDAMARRFASAPAADERSAL